MQCLESLLGGHLLGVFLGPAGAPALLPAPHHRGHLEGPLVRRSHLGDHGVLDELAAPGQALLQRGLVVDGVRERLLDLRLEGVDDRLGGLLVARCR
jgi:hypothetical protein